MPEIIVNMDDAAKRTRIANRINDLRGMYRIEVTRYRRRRSDRQNRFYWPCMVKPFGDFLREQGEGVTDLEAHEILKSRFLRKTITDPKTGTMMDYTRSTTELDTAEFNAYLDMCSAWLANMFGFIMPDPADYHERD
jgi:hypothetical protein